MYEQYVLDLLSDVFFGGACLSFCESLPLVSRNPDLSFWKSQISLFGRSGPLSIGIRRSRAVSGCRHLCRTG